MHQYKLWITISIITNIIYIKYYPQYNVTIYSCMVVTIRIPIHKQIVQLNIYGDTKWKLLQIDNDKYVFRASARIFNRW